MFLGFVLMCIILLVCFNLILVYELLAEQKVISVVTDSLCTVIANLWLF